MRAEDAAALRALVGAGRLAALGTLDDGAPFVSMVLYAFEVRPGAAPAALIHVSRLAAHTRHLGADPRASLMIVEPDLGTKDPQTLARLTLQCRAEALPRDDAGYQAAREHYLARLPAQGYLFDFPDFGLFRLVPHEARYVGGFARAFTLDAARLAELLAN